MFSLPQVKGWVETFRLLRLLAVPLPNRFVRIAPDSSFTAISRYPSMVALLVTVDLNAGSSTVYMLVPTWNWSFAPVGIDLPETSAPSFWKGSLTVTSRLGALTLKAAPFAKLVAGLILYHVPVYPSNSDWVTVNEDARPVVSTDTVGGVVPIFAADAHHPMVFEVDGGAGKA